MSCQQDGICKKNIKINGVSKRKREIKNVERQRLEIRCIWIEVTSKTKEKMLQGPQRRAKMEYVREKYINKWRE